jgi:non-ribosomal peptide synthetase component F
VVTDKFEADRIVQELDSLLINDVRKLSNDLGISEYSFWFSVVSLICGRVSNQSEICIATPVANRNRVQDHDSIGFFTNTLMLPISWNESDSIKEYLLANQRQLLKDLTHQSASLGGILHILKNKYDLDLEAGSDVVFSISPPRIESDDYFQITGLNVCHAKFPIAISLNLDTDNPVLEVEYRKYKYGQPFIHQFAMMINEVARHIVLNLEQNIGDV